MRQKKYGGKERRQFVRLEYVTPLAWKRCKKETISKLCQGYSMDVSQTGLLCNVKEKVSINEILWLSFNRTTLSICSDLEKKSLIYQNGVLGKVVRAQKKRNGIYHVGVQFITREEKNVSNIFPKIHFQKYFAK